MPGMRIKIRFIRMTKVGEISRKVQEKRLRWFGKRRGCVSENNDGFRSRGDEEEGQAKAATDGHNQGGSER